MKAPRRTASRAAAWLLGISACVCLACGGGARGTRPSEPTPNDLPTFQLIQENNQAWADWAQGDGLYVDRDFLNCYQLSGIPTPPVQPIDDASGHSRARRDCGESVQAVIGAIPAYERLAAAVTGVSLSAGSDQQPRFAAVMKARASRLAWAMNVQAAAAKGDSTSLNTLRQQIAQIAALESSALGIDLSKVPTPRARATIPYIPGVPTTTTPAPKR